MSRLFAVAILAVTFGCEKKVEPSEPPFVWPLSCRLDLRLKDGITRVEFVYDEKGALASRTGVADPSDKLAYAYDASGMVTELKTSWTSQGFSDNYTYKFTYGSDGKVSQHSFAHEGTVTSNCSYTWSQNKIIQESWTHVGSNFPWQTVVYTFSGDNITKEVRTLFKENSTEIINSNTIERSNFDSGFGIQFAYESRVRGSPFAHSRNNPGRETVNGYSVVNGTYQPDYSQVYVHAYTYNSSNVVLTKVTQIFTNGSSVGGLPVTDTFSYSGCQ